MRILDLVKRHPETLKQLAKLPEGQKSQVYGYVIEEMKSQFPNSNINEKNIESLLKIYADKGTLTQTKKDAVLEEERSQINIKFDKKVNKKEAAVLKRLGVPDNVINKVEKKIQKKQEQRTKPAKQKTTPKPKVVTKPKPKQESDKSIQAKIDNITKQHITGKPKDSNMRKKAEKAVAELEAKLKAKPPKDKPKDKVPVKKQKGEPTQAQLEKKLEQKIDRKKPLPPKDEGEETLQQSGSRRPHFGPQPQAKRRHRVHD